MLRPNWVYLLLLPKWGLHSERPGRFRHRADARVRRL